MGRSSKEIAAGVIALVPDSAPEKLTLAVHFIEILAFSFPPHIAPEVRDYERILKICKTCNKILGTDENKTGWKLLVYNYIMCR